MDRLLESSWMVVDTVYAVFMRPGEWLASLLIEQAPSLAASIGIAGDERAAPAVVILATLSWLIAALLIRTLRYPLRNLATAIGTVLYRLRYRTLIVFHGYRRRLRGGFDSLMGVDNSDAAEPAEKFSLNRLDIIILRFADAGGPGFTLSAPELATRLNLRADQIQESLDKLGRNKLLDFALGSTDGYESYRLNHTGSYVLTAWRQRQARV